MNHEPSTICRNAMFSSARFSERNLFGGIRGRQQKQPDALRVATLAIGTAAFAALPALAQDQTSHYQRVEKWDHGKKYYDYIGAPPPAPTQQEMESKRKAAAERNNLRGVEKWDHGKKYYDYAGTMPPAPTQQEMQSKQGDAAKRRHLRAVTKWDHGKKYTDYMPEGQSDNM
jgi:hypothetical protein